MGRLSLHADHDDICSDNSSNAIEKEFEEEERLQRDKDSKAAAKALLEAVGVSATENAKVRQAMPQIDVEDADPSETFSRATL